MDKYNGLLSKVSRQYHILRGNQETADEWKTRLVYSICGMMAYASLWDDTEESISIVHLRRRIRSILGSYKSLYPELLGTLPQNSEELGEEITNQFLSAGVVYHRPNRIVASKKHEEHFYFKEVLLWIISPVCLALDSIQNRMVEQTSIIQKQCLASSKKIYKHCGKLHSLLLPGNRSHRLNLAQSIFV